MATTVGRASLHAYPQFEGPGSFARIHNASREFSTTKSPLHRAETMRDNLRMPSAKPGKPLALTEAELDELQRLVDAVPAPLEPLDVSMIDGFLCGVLLQPQPIAPARWLPFVTDVDARALPRSFDPTRLQSYYAARGVKAEIDLLPDSGDAAPVLLYAARKAEAQVLVAGAFGHPRLQEFIFGGTTRTLLNSDQPSLFLSH